MLSEMSKHSKDIPPVYVWNVPPRSLMHRKTKPLQPRASSRQKLGHQQIRDPNKTTRNRLIEVALDDFATRGYDGTTTRQLAKHAGATIQAIQYHFGSKEGLYGAAIDQVILHLEKCLGLISKRIHFELEHRKPSQKELTHLLTQFFDAFVLALIGNDDSDKRRSLINRAEIERSIALAPLFEAMRRLAIKPCASIIGRLTHNSANSQETLVRTLALLGQVTIFCHKPARHALYRPQMKQSEIRHIRNIVQENVRMIFSKKKKSQ
jgi:AcrR family transcriptional regulator